VDLAKLSLWLATMAKDHPFTFLDHAIKCGDSLVGLSNQQIAAFHWDPTQAKQLIIGQTEMEKRMARVATERKRILDWTEDTEAAVLKKRDFLAAADSAAASLKTTGDLVIAAFFAGDKPKERQQLRDEFLHRHLELQKGENIAENLPWQLHTLNHLKGISSSSPSSFILQPSSFPIRPFHWEIEFPEVFSRENPGFDAIVGNPPFAGKNNLIGGHHATFPEWLKSLHAEAHGNADLVAHFFRRAFNLLQGGGTLGLIATNTIGQGDTRSTGLRWICTNGGTIFGARRRARWPGQVAVIVSIINIIKGTIPGPYDLDGKEAQTITAYLFHGGSSDDPATLSQNAGKSFIGSYILGMGFTFDDNDSKEVACKESYMRELIQQNPKNAERIFPYLGGEELNASPTHAPARHVINFGDFPLRRESLDGSTWAHANDKTRTCWLRSGIVPLDYPGPVAADWPDLLEIVEEKVKPDRLKDNRDGYRRYWWQFAEKRGELGNAAGKCSRLLVTSRVSPRAAFSFVSAHIVCAESMVVFPLESFSAFAVCQARSHENWARFFSSTAMELMRYSPSDAFETFPFPEDWETNAALEEAGREYYEYRAALMIRNNEGLTKTYNRFHDPGETKQNSPDIHKLRELHAAMDRAVLDAYGWTDIPTACEFLLDYEEEDSDDEAIETAGKKKRQKKKPWRYRWPDDVRDEVLARLLALNAERAEEERLAGQAAAFSASAKKARAKKSGASPLQGNLILPPQGDLFD
jgi:hypothetical protein